MKPIGQIRRERLKQLLSVGNLSFADLNQLLGRLRRDATLNQIAQAAPNSTTGKPREMGSVQARAIESKLKLPEGWFDTDPDRDGSDFVLSLPDGRRVVFEAKPAAPAANLAAEEPAIYNAKGWPFRSVTPHDLAGLAASHLDTLERMIRAFLGSPSTPPDWRTVALRLAADLDRKRKHDDFTTFVLAIEQELANSTRQAAPQASHI